MEKTLDVVYYSQPVPSSWQTLATLALVFDRVHFPGVYMGTESLDEGETALAVERLRFALSERMTVENAQLLNCMLVALHHKWLKDFCVFPGSFGGCGTLEPGANDLMMKLEEIYFGPPPPGFHPTPSSGFAMGLPGAREAGINGPSWLCYPANAFLYAARRGLPCLNDDPRMPMLVPPSVSLKNNAPALSAVLALESVRLILPSLKPLAPPDIHELRERTREDVQPFRRAMLKLTKSVNDAIDADSSIEDVIGAARFVVQTEVEPQLNELRRIVHDPGRHLTERLVDLSGPMTILSAGASSLSDLLVKVLGAILPVLVAEGAAQRERARTIRNSGLQFLLKVESR